MPSLRTLLEVAALLVAGPAAAAAAEAPGPARHPSSQAAALFPPCPPGGLPPPKAASLGPALRAAQRRFAGNASTTFFGCLMRERARERARA